MSALLGLGLLLSFLTYTTGLGDGCVLGVVGQPASLPCFHDALKTNSADVSVEWRTAGKVVLRSEWGEHGRVDAWSTSGANGTSVSSDAPQTGNFSLELSTVSPNEPQTSYSLFLMLSGEEQSPPLCTVCLEIAASFSFPLLHREDPVESDETVFICRSSGGFPEPTIHWLIDWTEEPSWDSVRTLTAQLPDSLLYNITSRLTVNVTQGTSVSCIIENPVLNETLTSISYGVQVSQVVRRASEAMWIFSTALCVVVGVMIFAGVVYQIHLDRTHKRKHKGKKDSSRYTDETVVMHVEQVETLTEANV
ncbi:ICOS ligand-like isoform X1 [Lampris incognitus]|uniref:ICOS ligand-like isoform X1 n=1 Tax=Lampris incognitus TaxID=2546036 RepID=UPI0024B560C8|nr:ICOS ligand-like isoform X1 [Lampris incognitus]XP_056132171.1 ICOS ligand-like isoform X1 [Lampris incognitus]